MVFDILKGLFSNEADKSAQEILDLIRLLRNKNVISSFKSSYPSDWQELISRLIVCSSVDEIKSFYKNSKAGELTQQTVNSMYSKAFDAICFEEAVKPILETHLGVLKKKIATLVYKDSYGDWVFDRWEKEVYTYYKSKVEGNILHFFSTNQELCSKLLRGFDFPNFHYIMKDLEGEKDIIFMIEKYIDSYSAEEGDFSSAEIDEASRTDSMSGHDYEYHIAGRVNDETNWSAEVTKCSGDQGADLLIYGPNGETGVVQVKLYSSKVGNKAVQEAAAARQHYSTDFACVVTNNFFTDSAIELAESCNVALFQEDSFIDTLAND